MWFHITVSERDEVLFSKFGTMAMVKQLNEQFSNPMFSVVAVELTEEME